MTEPEVKLVGIETIPMNRKSRYSFIDGYLDKIKGGQALRLIWPKGKNYWGLVCRWRRIAGEKAKYTTKSQGKDSIVIWLWIDK